MSAYEWELPLKKADRRGPKGKQVVITLNWPDVLIERRRNGRAVCYVINMLASVVVRFVYANDAGNWVEDGDRKTLASGETIGNALDRLAVELCKEVP